MLVLALKALNGLKPVPILICTFRIIVKGPVRACRAAFEDEAGKGSSSQR